MILPTTFCINFHTQYQISRIYSFIFKLPSNFFCLDLKIVISVSFTLSEILFTFNQLSRYFKPTLTSLFSFLIKLPRHKRLVSSAMWWTLQIFFAWLRSFAYKKNRMGLRTHPWGTPTKAESKPFTDTYWLRLDRYDFHQLFETPQIPVIQFCWQYLVINYKTYWLFSF